MRMRNVETPNNANKQPEQKKIVYCLIGTMLSCCINVMVFGLVEWLLLFRFAPGFIAKYRIAYSRPAKMNAVFIDVNKFLIEAIPKMRNISS